MYPIVDSKESEREDNEQMQCAKVVRLRFALKMAGIVAAVIVGIFGLMITAQAVGIDVFGAIGRWTEETFHFVVSSGDVAHGGTGEALSPENLSHYNSLQAALKECGITENLVPTWYPEDFEASDPTVSTNDFANKISCLFSDKTGKSFGITIKCYKSISDMELRTFEKDDIPVEQYVGGQKSFYIFSNVNTTTATYAEGALMITISGNLSPDEIKTMIDSIGGT